MGYYMIINEKEIVTVLQHVCNELLDSKDISIADMNVDVGTYITVRGNATYYNVDTKVKVVAKIECQPTKIIIHTRGIVKYGFITLDFNKLMKEYVKDNDYLHVIKDGIVIKNNYAQAITYGEGQIEIELK